MSSVVEVGEIAGAFGVHGWVRIRSYTDPPANILKYKPWTVESTGTSFPVKVIEGRPQGVSVVARLEGVEDRDQATGLKCARILVPRESFPQPPAGTYYWADLVGLEVVSETGTPLGKVRGLLETGANDVLDVRGDRDRLIPFVMGEYVKSVDLGEKRLIVDWDPDF